YSPTRFPIFLSFEDNKKIGIKGECRIKRWYVSHQKRWHACFKSGTIIAFACYIACEIGNLVCDRILVVFGSYLRFKKQKLKIIYFKSLL
ncbi:hypothetical protein O0F80_07070, partial [Staphylococcus pseudintermedius]|nr:hypothetical protein [Staphylococcus pseudintermedius]